MGKTRGSQGAPLRQVAKRARSRFVQPQERTHVSKATLRKSDLAQAALDILQGKEPDPQAIALGELIQKAQTFYDAGDWDACEPVIQALMQRRDMQQPMAYDAWGSCAQFQGRMDFALQCFRKALEIDPDYVEARNRMIMILDAQPTTTAAQAQRERTKWWNRHGAHLYAQRVPHTNTRDPERPLKIGYVSGDFQYHSAATVFHRIALQHSDGFIPYFYSMTPFRKYDHITNSYRAQPTWRCLRDASPTDPDGVPWPDQWAAHKMRSDEIDILVDLSGYTAHNKLGAFCHKPAPIQVTGWGYATGVGWPAMDYLVSDRVVVPEDRQAEHVERMLYLPTVIDYEPIDGLPEANPLPCLTERPTFGVFQRSLKINAEDLEVWRQVLERLPESRLLMKGHYCPSFKDWMIAAFKDQARQVEFLPVTSSFEHKVAYQHVDLNLDPWPQTGGVSACDALWQGVPAVTLLGPRVIQRTTASLLTTLGLTDFIAHTHEDYINKAVEWVTERKHELADIRQGLRARCDTSPIRQGYVEATEQGFRAIWREWCAQPMTIAEAAVRLQAAERAS